MILVFVFLLAFSFILMEREEEREITQIKKFQPRLLQQSPLSLKKEDFLFLSPWQKYVTPKDDAVIQIAQTIENERDAYKIAVHWVWVSDATLNGEQEKWLMPHDFLLNTPSYKTNPCPGRIASDCEEQAYTLVSVLRAYGMDAKNVRVVVGEVDFGGERGGHAWVEVFDGKWFALDATSGPYWDDVEKRLHERRGFPYTYFKNHPYPYIEIWGYFNDIYYYNPSTEEGNAPFHWKNIVLQPS